MQGVGTRRVQGRVSPSNESMTASLVVHELLDSVYGFNFFTGIRAVHFVLN